MLAKKYRFSAGEVFKKHHWRINKTSYFLLRIISNNLAFNRFAVMVNKKTAYKAVDRNTLKRLTFSFLKRYLFSGEYKKDILIMILPQSLGISKAKFSEELDKAIKQIN